MNEILNEKEFLKKAKKKASVYASNLPFPNISFENFFNPEYLKKVLDEFPNLDKETNFNDENQIKSASRGEKLLGPKTKNLIHYLNSEPFLNALSILTGIQNLLPDPSLAGGGYHEIKPGGFLKIHADFNVHPRYKLDRRLNLLIYLNPNWEKSYGGDFELWDDKMKKCVKKIPPLFNNVAIFSTTSNSYHGHPNPLTCPPNRTRKSIALYYYTNGRPKEEKIKHLEDHTTIFRARSQHDDIQTESYLSQKIKKSKNQKRNQKVIKALKLVTPPIILEALKKLSQKTNN